MVALVLVLTLVLVQQARTRAPLSAPTSAVRPVPVLSIPSLVPPGASAPEGASQ